MRIALSYEAGHRMSSAAVASGGSRTSKGQRELGIKSLSTVGAYERALAPVRPAKSWVSSGRGEDAGDGTGAPDGVVDCPLGRFRPQTDTFDQDGFDVGDAEKVEDGPEIALVVL